MRGAHPGRRRLVALLCAAALSVAPAAAAHAASDPIGVHSMLQVNSPYGLMQEAFAEASAAHAGLIRLDVAPALIFPDAGGAPDFSGLDEILALAQAYHLRVVADLFTTPPWLANCPSATSGPAAARCGTDQLASYGALLAQIVRHADPIIQDWEIWNEPDSGAFFSGTPQQYAGMLRTAHDTIKAIDPSDNVLLGGISRVAGMSWLAQVLATPGDDAVHAFDTANIHERAGLDQLAPDVLAWRFWLGGHGFAGPLWITEHGYPSDPTYQFDPSFTSGLTGQAAFLQASIPTLLDAGATAVFVTERDDLTGQFASEGLVSGGVSDTGSWFGPVSEKPSLGVVRAIADCYGLLGRDCAGAPPAGPATLIVPAARIGGASQATAQISDPGPGPAELAPAVLAGGGSSALSVAADGCPVVLEPNETCSIHIAFHPATGGPAAATLELPSGNGTLSVPLRAAAPSVASLSITGLFGGRFVPVGAGNGVGYTQRLSAVVSNRLPAPVRIGQATLAGADPRQFAIPPGGCLHRVLPAGASCRLTVLFKPRRKGTARAGLTLHGDGLPLAAGLIATAYTPPELDRLTVSGSGTCLAAGQAILAEASEAATVSWRAVRVSGLAPACATASTAGGATVASGWATARRARLAGGTRGYLARLTLPAGGRHHLRPGVYLLTASARNRHGVSRVGRLVVTVAG